MKFKLIKTLEKLLGIQSPSELWTGAKHKKETPPKRSWKDYLSDEQKEWHRKTTVMLCWQVAVFVLSVIALILSVKALITQL